MNPAIDHDGALAQVIGGAVVALLLCAASLAIWAWGTIRDRRR